MFIPHSAFVIPNLKMRTFIAIEIPENVKERMTEVQATLRKADIDASWPRPEGIHLTLKFLGEVPESQIDEIRNALARAVRGINTFRLEGRGTGAFPNARSARVVWMGLSGEMEKLKQLQAAVEENLVRIGLEREDRPFKPHLTLARIKYIRSREAWQKILDQVKDIQLPGFEVSAVSLMKSELKRTGAEYTEVAKVELK
jgi:2'-5' RNA ligase